MSVAQSHYYGCWFSDARLLKIRLNTSYGFKGKRLRLHKNVCRYLCVVLTTICLSRYRQLQVGLQDWALGEGEVTSFHQNFCAGSTSFDVDWRTYG